jgi:hypothetical protein
MTFYHPNTCDVESELTESEWFWNKQDPDVLQPREQCSAAVTRSQDHT